MRLKGKNLDERLAKYSRSTLVLISEIMRLSRETVYKMLDITTDSELNEEQVVEKLLELKSSALARTAK